MHVLPAPGEGLNVALMVKLTAESRSSVAHRGILGIQGRPHSCYLITGRAAGRPPEAVLTSGANASLLGSHGD